ncbi:aminotransferase class I/II-fold pyridoxal phosphate-dependent enzyme [Nocardioides sp. GY 10127]|uniref:aminotransferase class I/II-fold pyridoxal phosphate-dependent enzyme n=1 Tax=Nocardioides sp. GY 10127 TaxID=2569762 RepID=UPI0010A7C654|nr:aminotransferase class I/II-fold pyridoxal phosphate-dependent enzyme [Nocardioides sp. GY 10127]TIC82857.1 aminotransferase class I/II-fold pyridoxal phosphate-dependent enzyme [Nocardioides sp. GY 10127]
MIVDLTDEQARRALPLKWGAVPEGTVPAWVAEADYAPAPAIAAAVDAAVSDGMLGYAPFAGTGHDAALDEAFRGFARRHWGWELPAGRTVVTGDVVAGVRLVLETLCPPGPVVVPAPYYPPFHQLTEVTGRALLPVDTDPDAPDAPLDLAGIERRLVEDGARTVVLCSPHNPTGRVHRRDELEALRDLTRAHGARVVADEIHAPLVLPGSPAFVPYLTVDERAVAVTSHSKTFSTAGLHTAQVVTLDDEDLAVLRAVPHAQNGGASVLGMVAGVAAWNDCDAWLEALLERLVAQRALLGDLLAEHLPLARTRVLEATYLAWVDLRAYGVEDPAAAGLAHGVKVSPGHDYHPGLAGHVRINLATDARRLRLVVERLAAALV